MYYIDLVSVGESLFRIRNSKAETDTPKSLLFGGFLFSKAYNAKSKIQSEIYDRIALYLVPNQLELTQIIFLVLYTNQI
ncbi:MAG: hypothetical protein COU06_00260 [Candidatus Harrisonbacteria bacterium CG10_big_fil_rev_8_21_14_0_10_38_8]|uniref:Uncharacterized protein n=1 Tax=Candidatus Harrisonbacteria bacterium CG10_big_fil_rev_8_21_14_0_10_38_8 TaxID=1974582 RepID=A0A2M6WKR1_9BACT|nr:MAG: hypothetical protein COU06_00260 [Candidatus Harrisonbacteria bacterium CG10_big_fil_rev_8_21_14_0_10_38_8]